MTEQEKLSRRNKYLAWKHFYPEGKGEAKIGYVLHHVDTTLRHNNAERYNEWNVEDLVMITKKEHGRLHHEGIPRSEATRQKISESLKGEHHPMSGKSLSEEHKRKLSESNKGRHLSEEAKRKISEARKGKALSEEHRKKLSESCKGKRISEETKRKMSEGHKRYWLKRKQKNVEASVD